MATAGLCAICRETLNLQLERVSALKCGHLFHATCLNAWVESCRGERQPTCPHCRNTVNKVRTVKKLFPVIPHDRERKEEWREKMEKEREKYENMLKSSNEVASSAKNELLVRKSESERLKCENLKLKRLLEECKSERRRLKRRVNKKIARIKSLRSEKVEHSRLSLRTKKHKKKIK